ncbi:MAG TPA: IS701 family transposase, partial [Coleofasciculaceae cyanobacterium]
KAFRVIVLADTAFGSVDFLKAVRQRRYPAIVGVRCDRKLQDGRQVCGLCKRGQQVRLDGLSFPVTISWLYLKRDGFPRETICPLHSPPQRQYYHLVGETSPLQLKDSLKPANIDESLHRFGQGTLLGVYRWLVLSLIAFILAHACLLVHQPITTS